jgi:hypothetical protein
MPWHCPSCATNLPHRDGSLPDPAVKYRCATCRLELVADVVSAKMILVPLPTEAEKPPRLHPKKKR